MKENATIRVLGALRWFFVVVMPMAAAAAYLLYMANGIAAGGMIGIAGLESSVALAQRYATHWLSAFWVFQVCAVIALFSVLRFGADAAPAPRYLSRGLVAFLLSFPLTLFFGMAIYELMSLFRPHIR